MTGSHRPVVIIGAPRSGTNMLRDALTALPGLGTWPCDEINLIWKHGNVHEPTDELSRQRARPEVRAYIRRAFDRIGSQQGGSRVVEKTCANSLRVGFVDEVLPDAQYVYIVRDGRDAATSAAKRWRAKVELAYTIRKVRYAPVSDLPLHAARFLRNRIHRLGSKEDWLGSWGPRFKGIDKALANSSLLEVCAMQWKRCVDFSDAQLSTIEEGRVHRISYESFIQDPAKHLEIICSTLEEAATSEGIVAAVSHVTQGNAGKWRKEVDAGQTATLQAVLEETLARHGY